METNFSVTEDYYIIRLGSSDKVDKEINGLLSAWEEYMEFIYSSYKQMADVIISSDGNDNESRILKTPRRISRRAKRSSALKISSALKKSQLEMIPVPTPRRVSKRKISSAFKTQDLVPTPRRVSKRGKKSSVAKALDLEPSQLKVSEDNQNNGENATLELFSELTINDNDNKMEIDINEDDIKDNQTNYNQIEDIQIKDNETKENDFKEVESKDQNDNKLNLKSDKDNESDKEWMTDDEDGDQKMETEEFFDAIDERKDKNETKRKLNTSVANDIKKPIPTSTSKPKKKKKLSQYFTPQAIISRSGRATTRMQSRIADSSRIEAQTTPSQTKNQILSNTGSKSSGMHPMATRQMEANITSSGESNSQKYGSSSRSQRYVSRIQKQVPDTKSLTASAAKRRQEQEEQRRLRLQASQEKEKRAIEKRQILIEQTVNEKKLKSQEKYNRAAELRELQKQKELEKLKKEQEKREEQERKLKKLEEERREILRKKHEEMMKKTLENERRKQLQEMKEAQIKLQKQEELKRRQELEREKQQEQERMTAMIQQHNNSLQQKAVAQSFLKKCELIPKVVLNKISPPQNSGVEQKSNVSPPEKLPKAEDEQKANKTFVVDKNEEKEAETSVYDMTPPPKEHNYDNYDISEIKSDDDTDDERHPRKHIPNWARGSQFVETLKRQYAKSSKSREREIRTIFSSGVQLPVELGLIFGAQRSVHAKYSKRTSSAVWNSPPALHPNISMNSSRSDKSFFN